MVTRLERPACARYSRPISNSANKLARARLKMRSAFSRLTWAAASRLPSPWYGGGVKRDAGSSVHARGGWSLWVSGARPEEEREVVRARLGATERIRFRKWRCRRQR